jgi:hypothetical protein
MSLPIYVDAYSGYKANERPRQFVLDEDNVEIEAVEEQWRSPDGEYFKIRTTGGKRYLLRYEVGQDQWTLQTDFGGAELFTRPSIELITVEAKAIREAESQIAACERCRPERSEIPFDWILADILDKHGGFGFALAEPAKCPNCRSEVSEKTLVTPEGGIEIENMVVVTMRRLASHIFRCLQLSIGGVGN